MTDTQSLSPSQEPEQAVLVFIKLPDDWGSDSDWDSIFGLEARLEEAIDRERAGELDGDEFGEGFCTIYMYGPDADGLVSVISPILKEYAMLSGSYAIKRYGEPGAREVRIDL